MTLLYFEDFPEGQTRTHAEFEISRDSITAFAKAYDPKPCHLDEQSAKQTLTGEFCASNWQIMAQTMRAICDGYLLNAASMGANRIEKVRVFATVKPGDRLRLRHTVLSKRVSRGNPQLGILNVLWEMLDQHDEVKLTMQGAGFIKTRTAEPNQ